MGKQRQLSAKPSQPDPQKGWVKITGPNLPDGWFMRGKVSNACCFQVPNGKKSGWYTYKPAEGISSNGSAKPKGLTVVPYAAPPS